MAEDVKWCMDLHKRRDLVAFLSRRRELFLPGSGKYPRSRKFREFLEIFETPRISGIVERTVKLSGAEILENHDKASDSRKCPEMLGNLENI